MKHSGKAKSSRRNYYRPTIFVFFSVSLQRQLIFEKEKRVQKNVVFFALCNPYSIFLAKRGPHRRVRFLNFHHILEKSLCFVTFPQMNLIEKRVLRAIQTVDET